MLLTCANPDALNDMRRRELRERLAHTPWHDAIARVALFSPHPEYARVASFDDGPPPAAIIELSALSRASLIDAGNHAAVHTLLVEYGGVGAWTAAAFEIIRTPVGGSVAAVTRSADLSFVVRYFPPVADAAQFAAHYVRNHPPILARLPRVRNVLCYVPLWQDFPGIAPDHTTIRNEVVFDSLDDLLRALQSPVRAELRADTQTFPAFGHSTHHAMTRTVVFSRSQ